jgi:archaellum component FlaC
MTVTDNEYRRLVEFLSGQFTQIDARFDQIDARFDQMDARLDRMDARFAGIDRSFGEVDRRFADVDRRIEALETRQEERFREILGHFGELYRRLERLEAEYFAIVQTLRRIETLVAGERVQRETLAQSVDDLRRQVAELQSRIDAVEARLQG